MPSRKGSYTIAIVDYRAGNLTSVKKALDPRRTSCITSDLGIDAREGHRARSRTLALSDLESFRTAMQPSPAIDRGTPFLGICLGMQWLFDGSEEAPASRPWHFSPASASRFPAEVKSPHVGWNSLEMRTGSRLLQGVPPDAFVYFTHSYRAPSANDGRDCRIRRRFFGGG